MIYLGTPGRMVGISCPAEQRLSTAERYSFQTTLEGQVKAQVRPEGPRTWDLRLPRTSTPSEVAALAAFANGAWGPGPFWFVSADAPVVNLLTPKVASCAPDAYLVSGGTQVTPAGPIVAADGHVAPRSFIRTEQGGMFFGQEIIPLIPEMPLTVSAYLGGVGGTLAITYYDETGAFVATRHSDAETDSNEMVRLSMTSTPPENAAGFRIQARNGATRLASPAATFTHEVYEWGDGQGCEKAVVLGGQRDLIRALDNPNYGRFADYSFTVQEVG